MKVQISDFGFSQGHLFKSIIFFIGHSNIKNIFNYHPFLFSIYLFIYLFFARNGHVSRGKTGMNCTLINNQKSKCEQGLC